VTTKDRLNKYSPALVYQEQWEWYVGREWQGEKCVPFRDGMLVDGEGHPVEG
jgi:hypothetical protein